MRSTFFPATAPNTAFHPTRRKTALSGNKPWGPRVPFAKTRGTAAGDKKKKPAVEFFSFNLIRFRVKAFAVILFDPCLQTAEP